MTRRSTVPVITPITASNTKDAASRDTPSGLLTVFPPPPLRSVAPPRFLPKLIPNTFRNTDKEKCVRYLEKIGKELGIDDLICGICIKVCPVGK